MKVNLKGEAASNRLGFPLSEIINFCFDKVSDEIKACIGTELIFNNELLQTVRKIRRIQRENGADYELILKKMQQLMSVSLMLFSNWIEF